MFINLFLMYVFVDFFCNDIIFLILIFMCLKLFRNINIIIFKGFDSVLQFVFKMILKVSGLILVYNYFIFYILKEIINKYNVVI